MREIFGLYMPKFRHMSGKVKSLQKSFKHKKEA